MATGMGSVTPLAIDLFCGLGGWTDGLLAEGYDVVGFDIERHDYSDGKRYPAQLVLQDVLTLHGRQFRDATLIVASPPCQEYSYMAMPWSRAKKIAQDYRTGARDVKKLTALFDACFRIQREAIEAAGHFIPLVVENVRGACPWVGRSRWNFGSFHLWGDVPALMPMTRKAVKVPGLNWSGSDKSGYVAKAFNTTAEQRLREDGKKVPGFRFDGSGGSFQTASVKHAAGGAVTRGVVLDDAHGDALGRTDSHDVVVPENAGSNPVPAAPSGTECDECPSGNCSDCPRKPAHEQWPYGIKNSGGSWFNIGSPGQKEVNRNPVHEGMKTLGHVNKRDGHSHTRHLTNQRESDGVKQHKSGRAWFADPDTISGSTSSKSNARKAASAAIAKIPLPLARHIARTWAP